MRTFTISMLFILFINGNNFAQWTEQTSGVSTSIFSVSAVDNNVVWACGENGTVLQTIADVSYYCL